MQPGIHIGIDNGGCSGSRAELRSTRPRRSRRCPYWLGGERRERFHSAGSRSSRGPLCELLFAESFLIYLQQFRPVLSGPTRSRQYKYVDALHHEAGGEARADGLQSLWRT